MLAFTSPHHACTEAVFAADSPSCGNGVIEDGEYCELGIEPECCNGQCRLWDFQTLGGFAAGSEHYCLIRYSYRADSGAVDCFGSNEHGESTPPPGDFMSVAAGRNFTCAQRRDQTVVCWGDDSEGQATPPAGKFHSIKAGDSHACGVRENGAIECWGNDADGRTTPPEETLASLTTGSSHSCGVNGDHEIRCWGTNSDGESNPPEGIFVSVAAGDRATCAINSDYDVVCWGNNSAGQADPPDDLFVTALAMRGSHACALKSYYDDPVCWGSNESGQSDPVPFTVASDYNSLALGDRFSCRFYEYHVDCWGEVEGRIIPTCGPTLPVRGDTCDDALPIEATHGSHVHGDINTGAEVDYPECGGDTGDLWYSFELESAASVEVLVNDIDPLSATFDASVALLRGDTCDGLEQLACDQGDRPGFDARIATTNLTAGRYFVVIGGHGDEGATHLDVIISTPNTTTTTTLPSTATTTQPGGGCGDDAVQEGEQCDDGDSSYEPGDVCSRSCLFVVCGRPVTDENGPRASDALFVLHVAVDLGTCAGSVCDVNTDGSITVADALTILQVSVGRDIPLQCPPLTD